MRPHGSQRCVYVVGVVVQATTTFVKVCSSRTNTLWEVILLGWVSAASTLSGVVPLALVMLHDPCRDTCSVSLPPNKMTSVGSELA